jgi:hypothetical protein
MINTTNLLLRRRRGSILNRPSVAALWKAGIYDPTLDSLLDLSGHGLHMRLGSAVGADTNDPLRLTYDGQKSVYFPGVAGNYISAPDSAALSITGDIDIRAKVALSDWSPAADNGLVAKVESGTTRSYRLVVLPSGLLLLEVSLNGTTFVSQAADTPVPFTDGTTGWVRGTRNAATGEVRYYTSTDGTAWTQLGAARTTAAGSIFDSTSRLELGSSFFGAGQSLSGSLYRAQIYSGIDGTKVFDFDASQLVEPYASVTDVHGNVCTLNRSASGRKLAVVDRDMLLFGTDDYGEVQDHALLNFGVGESLTLAMAMRDYSTTTGALNIFAAKVPIWNFTDKGFLIGRISGDNYYRAVVMDGIAGPAGGTPLIVAGTASLISLVRNQAIKTIRGYRNATGGTPSTDTTTDLANASALRFGRLAGAGTSYADFEFFGAAAFREALSQTDLQRLAVELGVTS